MVEGVMGLLEGTQVVRQATSAYRDNLVEEGFSPEIAEQMTIEFHRFTMALFTQKILGDTAAAQKAGRSSS